MIKLKPTGKELKALSAFFQRAIEIARAEIHGAFDYEVYRVENNRAVKQVLWSQNSNERALKVAIRHAHIDEFEKAQRKFINSYDYKKDEKPKAVQLTKSAGAFFLFYMVKVEAIYQEPYITSTAMHYGNDIHQQLI